MTSNDPTPDTRAEHPDGLTPDQARRFQLWRAVASLAQAQADGKLTVEQARLLESLAETLQRLAAQLNDLAVLGQQYGRLLDAERSASIPGTAQPPER
jgi:hypothetical protein